MTLDLTKRNELARPITAAEQSADAEAIETAVNGITDSVPQATLLGRASGAGTGAASYQDQTAIRNIIGTFTDSARGLVPASGTADGTKVLFDDGTWAAPDPADLTELEEAVEQLQEDLSALEDHEGFLQALPNWSDDATLALLGTLEWGAKNPTQITSQQISDGTDTELVSVSPADLKSAAETHGGAAGTAKSYPDSDVSGASDIAVGQTWRRYTTSTATLVVLTTTFADEQDAALHHRGSGTVKIVASNGLTINDQSGVDSTSTETVTVQNSSGANTELAGTGLPLVTAGAYFQHRNHSTAANNGWFVATGSPTTSLIPCTKLANADGSALTNPANAGSESVDIDIPVDLTLDALSMVRRDGTNFTVQGGTDATDDFNGSDVEGVADLTATGTVTAAAVTASGAVTGADLAATDDLTVGDDAAITGDLTVGGEISGQLSPWQTGTGSFAAAASGRSWNVTGNITAVPVTNGWHGRFKNESGSSKTIAGASGTFVSLLDGTTGTTLTLGDDRGCDLHANGTNIMVMGVVTLA